MNAQTRDADVRTPWSDGCTTRDPAIAHDWMRQVYFDHRARLSGDRGEFRFVSGRAALGSMAISGLRHTADTSLTSEQSRDRVVVLKVTRGRYAASNGRGDLRLSAGLTGLLPAHDRLAIEWRDLSINAVTFDKYELSTLAQDLTGHDGVVADLRLSQPIGTAQADRFWRTAASVIRPLCQEQAAAGPLVHREAKRLLVAALLEAFPGRPAPRAERHPLGAESWLRRALTYIDDNAHRDIALLDIAVAARVSPRTLQAGFRRHLGTTPLEQLRTVRLVAVREELLAAEPGTRGTVARIARQWGFTHLGRFAAAYRERFGETPRMTLGS